MSPPPSSGWRPSRPAENPVSPRIPHVITASGAACSPRTTPSQKPPKFDVLLLREGSASNRLPNLGTLAGEDALELLRGACHDPEVQVAQAIADVLIGEGLGRRSLHRLSDFERRPLRRDHRDPPGRGEALDAALRHCGEVWRLRAASGVRGTEGHQLSSGDEGLEHGRCLNDKIRMLARGGRAGSRAADMLDNHEIELALLLQHLSCEMWKAPVSRRRGIELSWVGPDQVDKIFHRLDWKGRPGSDDEVEGGDLRDRSEVEDVGRRRLGIKMRVRGQCPGCRDQEGVTVRRRARDLARGKAAIGPSFVFYDDWLAKLFRELRTHQPSNDVRDRTS